MVKGYVGSSLRGGAYFMSLTNIHLRTSFSFLTNGEAGGDDLGFRCSLLSRVPRSR